MTYQEQYAAWQALVEQRLGEFFPGGGLNEAMRYSLMAGGKRLRGVLVLAFCEAAGGELGRNFPALDFACAVEMMHAYSLIHDDLPCMDNADLRRGKPSCHKAFGETVAVLAGDALQAEAFRTVLCAPAGYRVETCHFAAMELARAVGTDGMCLGQYRDTLEDGCPHTLEDLNAINAAKTGALLEAACCMGATAAEACGGHTGDEQAAAREYGKALGLAFQIQDDILDVTSTAETLGKPIGADEANRKTTYVTLLGVDECRKRVAEYTRQAKEALKRPECQWFGGTEFLKALADQLAHRVN